MKFLVDAHLPPSLCHALAEQGHDAIHTSSLPEGNATTDAALRSAAIAQGRVVVTKDLDFFDELVLRGAPPKLLLVRCGNLRKHDLVAFVISHLDSILSGLTEGDLAEIGAPVARPR